MKKRVPTPIWRIIEALDGAQEFGACIGWRAVSAAIVGSLAGQFQVALAEG